MTGHRRRRRRHACQHPTCRRRRERLYHCKRCNRAVCLVCLREHGDACKLPEQRALFGGEGYRGELV